MKESTLIKIFLISAIVFIVGMVCVLLDESKDRCTKTSTHMIEINGEKADYLICTSGDLPVILKKY